MTWAEAYGALVDVHSFLQREAVRAREAGDKVEAILIEEMASKLPLIELRDAAYRALHGGE